MNTITALQVCVITYTAGKKVLYQSLILLWETTECNIKDFTYIQDVRFDKACE